MIKFAVQSIIEYSILQKNIVYIHNLKFMKRKILLQALLLSLFLSCVNIDKKIGSGNYDSAINTLVGKLKGKKNKSNERIMQLETAFKKANDADLRSIHAYKADAQEENWERILTIYQNIENRQRKIEPLVPIQSKDGYLGRFTFIDIDEDKRQAKSRLAEYYLNKATKLISDSRSQKNKSLAKQAFGLLERIDPLYKDFKNKESLKAEALSLATEYTLISMENNTMQIIPTYIEENILSFDVSGLESRFKKYHTVAQNNLDYDQLIILELNQLNISPEREKTRVYDETFEEEKEEVLKDSKGKVLKDSLGREIRKKIKRSYTTTIEEVTQLKTVALEGKIDWLKSKKNLADYSKPVNVEAVFQNEFAVVVKGEKDKLNDKCKKKIQNRAMPFPDNNAMLVDAAEKMKNLMKDLIYERER